MRCLELVDDIVLAKDEIFWKKKYFLISEKRGKYLKLTEEQYKFYDKVIQSCCSDFNEVELEEAIKKYSNEKISLKQLKETLKKYNLLKEPTVKEQKCTVELEFSSRKVCEINLYNIQIKYERGLKYLWNIIKLISNTLILLATVIFLKNLQDGIVGFKNTEVYITDINYIFLGVGLFLCVVLHEIGHLLSANNNGIKWKNINFALRWGISFVYYVKYKNFYAHSSKEKLYTILSGVYMNFVQVCMCYIIYYYYDIPEAKFLMIVNILSITNNLLPKGTCDGYHALCILTGLEGIRWKMLKLIAKILKDSKYILKIIKDKTSLLLIVYFVFSYTLSLYACYKFFLYICDYLLLISNYWARNISILFVGFIIFATVMSNVVKLIRSIKRM